ncbi:tetratricopeptide repeat protein [uncultured Enterovirga sp.]|uniref:tetratricopeptide repeat protein n=1 Tax=uncultured Enterovirga sp. TaxID=2026352 RepID=UPI0035CAE604
MIRSAMLPTAVAALLTLGAVDALFAQPRPAEATGPAPTAAPRAPGQLDELFARLASAKDEDEAKGVANLIERRLERSGSDTADLLMQRSGEALKGEDAALAVELLDRVMQLKPDWAEAWNRRAAAFHRLEDSGQAILDLQQALVREPRHFTAWTALGHLELAQGNSDRALAAFRKALKIHPHLASVTTIVERLAPEVDGRDL